MCQQLNKLNRQILAFTMAIILLICCAPAARADGESGSCGDNLTWSLSAGTLTISGSGAMSNFPESTMAPWYSRREEIIRLELPSGLTRIGNLAFYGCKNLTTVSIPNSVETIGEYAFADCKGLELLTIGSGVRTIGEAAFSDCYRLQSLTLPGSLKSIGLKGFYRCESITSVTVPSSVTSMGVSVFAYCKKLVSANIQASIATLPEYMFYGCERLTSVSLPDTTDSISEFSFRGCDQLSTVYYGGTSQTLDQIQEAIGSEVPAFDTTGSVTDEKPIGSVSAGSGQENADGTITQENITVTPGDNTTVTTVVENTSQPDGSDSQIDAEVTVVVGGSDGWDEAKENVEDQLENLPEQTENVTVNVYVQDIDEIDPDFIDAIVGENVTVIVTTQNGSVWKMDGSQLGGDSSGEYNLSYTLTAGTEELSAELGSYASFFLTFAESAEVNSEVLIRIGSSYAYQEATLLQRDKEGATRIQTVVVDREGYAHFYLASVDKDTEYYIAMNLPKVEDVAPIIPQELTQDYGNVVNYTPIEYEITGRTSSWGMNLGQVMGILAAVMGSVIVIVGVVMYILNKRRLRNGYIPQWDDEE